MGSTNLNDIDVLLGDHDQNSLSILRAVLGNSGFRNMQVGRTLDEVRENVANELPDLLICDYDIPGGDFFDFVHDVRHHEIGRNPFLAIIAVTRTPSPEIVRRISECGVDHLIIKPFSTNQMIDRINALVDARRMFVVTSDYIGPDRRGDLKRDSKVMRMKVPNTLKAKVLGRASPEAIQRAIDLTVSAVNVQKLERYDDEIAFLVDKIVPSMAAGGFNDVVLQYLKRLLYVTGDASRRLVGTGYAHVSDLCQALYSVTNTVFGAQASANERDVQLLGLLAQAIKASFGASEDMIAAAREISNEALSRFRQVQAERTPEPEVVGKRADVADVADPADAPPVYGIVSKLGRDEARAAPASAPPRQQGRATGLEAATPRAEGGEGGEGGKVGNFDDVFVESLSEFIHQRLAPWEVDGGSSGRVPFLLSAGFRESLCEVIQTYVADAIPSNRRMVVLAGSVDRNNVSPDLFASMFNAPEKENVPRFLWNNWWGDIGKVLSADGKTFGVHDSIVRDGVKIWDIIDQAAVAANFDPPLISDIPVIQALFDYDQEEIRSVMRGAKQVLGHEADDVTDAGASRNFFLAQIDALPPHCGDWLALWAYHAQPAEFGNEIQKSFAASTGRTAKERRAVLPYYLRWAPDLTRTPLDDAGNIIEATEASAERSP